MDGDVIVVALLCLGGEIGRGFDDVARSQTGERVNKQPHLEIAGLAGVRGKSEDGMGK